VVDKTHFFCTWSKNEINKATSKSFKSANQQNESSSSLVATNNLLIGLLYLSGQKLDSMNWNITWCNFNQKYAIIMRCINFYYRCSSFIVKTILHCAFYAIYTNKIKHQMLINIKIILILLSVTNRCIQLTSWPWHLYQKLGFSE